MTSFLRDCARVLNAPCKEHSELFSRACDHPLTRGERVGLWLHLRICKACREFKAQLARLWELHRAASPQPEPHMPTEVRDRIAARLGDQA